MIILNKFNVAPSLGLNSIESRSLQTTEDRGSRWLVCMIRREMWPPMILRHNSSCGARKNVIVHHGVLCDKDEPYGKSELKSCCTLGAVGTR